MILPFSCRFFYADSKPTSSALVMYDVIIQGQDPKTPISLVKENYECPTSLILNKLGCYEYEIWLLGR